MRAQGTPYVPAENFLLVIPGMTTERGGTTPLYIFSSSPVTSMIFVEDVNTTLAAITASLSIFTPSK